MPSPKKCEWTNQEQSFAAFAGFTEKTQSAGHIRPLHWYVACRLVVEGGFHPDDIIPRPPFTVGSKRKGYPLLVFDPSAAGSGEATLLGGLKTKKVDVVVTRKGIGPVLAVSCKGTTGAFRNLTNRMEELIGDCTNLHISYPALVLGYLHLLRGNRQVGEVLERVAELEEEGEDEPRKVLTANDIAFEDDGSPVAGIVRYNNALERLAGRNGIRDDVTRYESMALALVEATSGRLGEVFVDYPRESSVLNPEHFFDVLYAQYDERFVYGAPVLATTTRRLEWSTESPALSGLGVDYMPRVAVA